MNNYRKNIGNEGESIAADYLKERGYQILATNQSCPHGEIDIIAQKGKKIHFVEIRRRLNQEFGSAIESITKTKMSRIRKTATFLRNKHISWRSLYPYFSVIAIDGENENLKIEFLPDAFI
jgi:putative endonuclease